MKFCKDCIFYELTLHLSWEVHCYNFIALYQFNHWLKWDRFVVAGTNCNNEDVLKG